MAWQTPKTNWEAPDGVRNTDMNRIEENIRVLGNSMLAEDVTLYVATSGSDTSGDGSSENPYASISKAIEVLPKNLNGKRAVIEIESGTYQIPYGGLVISDFSGGYLTLAGNGEVTLNGIDSLVISNCTVVTQGIDITISTITVALSVAYNGTFIHNGYLNTNGSFASTNTALSVAECSKVRIGSLFSKGDVYFATVIGSSIVSVNNISVDSTDASGHISGSIFTYGTVLDGTVGFITTNGGQVFTGGGVI